ncbi:SDR family oxidoreductase [uncultured Aeromicrobium sp.]|uniref:SDR family oxidoreductase n=1 Tax=uncultured Aeromicrobium sp. TaxID=337820 RepID=UPI0025DFE570|nr:SDR family oxidoreductase [uncultured Aeromicrobium sp.]
MPRPDVNEPALSEGFPAQQQEPPGVTTAMEPLPDHGENSYVGHGKLDGKRTLITGGDSGIGRAVALAFARESADVAFTYQPEESEDAAQTARLVEAEQRRSLAIEADLRDNATCKNVIAQVAEQFGGLDVLVNNAGYQYARRESIADMTDEQLERVLDTNLKAMFILTREAMAHLRRSRGNIINVSSIQAYEPSTSLLDYAATKAAINNFTVNLAQEAGADNVRVNAVAPGPIWTPLQPATQSTEKLEQFGQETPLGRAGQPAECAPAFVFLANDTDAGYVSGTVLGVTGGKGVF